MPLGLLGHSSQSKCPLSSSRPMAEYGGILKSQYFCPTWDPFVRNLFSGVPIALAKTSSESCSTIWGSSYPILPPPPLLFTGVRSACHLPPVPSFTSFTCVFPNNSLVHLIPHWWLLFRGPELIQHRKVWSEQSLEGGHGGPHAGYLGAWHSTQKGEPPESPC